MAVPQTELIRRFLEQPPEYWERPRVATRKNRLEVVYPRITSEGHTIAYVDYVGSTLRLLDANPSWGSQRLSRSISRQLNTLAGMGGALGYEVLVANPIHSEARALGGTKAPSPKPEPEPEPLAEEEAEEVGEKTVQVEPRRFLGASLDLVEAWGEFLETPLAQEQWRSDLRAAMHDIEEVAQTGLFTLTFHVRPGGAWTPEFLEEWLYDPANPIEQPLARAVANQFGAHFGLPRNQVVIRTVVLPKLAPELESEVAAYGAALGVYGDFDPEVGF